VLVAVQFTEERRALEFERFLKSGSGRAFARRHLLTVRHPQTLA
jgi:hypothetical protein